MNKETPRPSPLGLAVLGLLRMGPLHPYGMQRLIKDWGKDQVIDVRQRASLYRTIQRLERAGLIVVRQTERAHQYPERTLYELTTVGRRLADEWLRQMLQEPRDEYPAFPAALSFASFLGPEDLRRVLDERRTSLTARLAQYRAELAQLENLPRIFGLETHFQKAAIEAELAWVEAVIEELASGTLRWSSEDFAAAAGVYRDLMGSDPSQP
jgi:DNA-binding PadR family transcriptional regulator